MKDQEMKDQEMKDQEMKDRERMFWVFAVTFGPPIIGIALGYLALRLF